jgi:protein involved in polysaccharide export with SLBB domain
VCVAVVVIVAVTASCATTEVADNFVWVDDLGQEQLEPTAYRIRGGDQLQVSVFKQEALSGPVLVATHEKNVGNV